MHRHTLNCHLPQHLIELNLQQVKLPYRKQKLTELINIAVAIEDEFDVEISDREVTNIETLGDAIRIIEMYMD